MGFHRVMFWFKNLSRSTRIADQHLLFMFSSILTFNFHLTQGLYLAFLGKNGLLWELESGSIVVSWSTHIVQQLLLTSPNQTDGLSCLYSQFLQQPADRPTDRNSTFKPYQSLIFKV